MLGVTTTYETTTTSEHSAGNSAATAPKEFPALFWAAVILFVVNLLVLFAIWVSPDLRVSMYGENEGSLAGAYVKPSPFTEQVVVTAANKVRRPEKVRPAFYQGPQPDEAAELDLPRTTMPVSAEQNISSQRAVESYAEFPRMTASAASTPIRHVGSVDVAPRRATEQP